MKPKSVLLCIAIALAMSLLLIYSLMGTMTGIYVCPVLGYLDETRSYLVRREAGWSVISITSKGPYVMAAADKDFRVVPGIWLTTLIRSSDGTEIRAFAPLNMVDVFALKFGKYRELGR